MYLFALFAFICGFFYSFMSFLKNKDKALHLKCIVFTGDLKNKWNKNAPQTSLM